MALGWQNCTYVSGSWTYAKEDLEFQTYLGATPGEARLSPLEFEKLDKEKVNNVLYSYQHNLWFVFFQPTF